MDRKDLFDNLTSVLITKGFSITNVNLKVGLLQAETAPSFNAWTGQNTKRVWTIQLNQNNHLTATARTENFSTNAFGTVNATAVTYYNDDSSEDWDWYWDVRKAIEEYCGSHQGH